MSSIAAAAAMSTLPGGPRRAPFRLRMLGGAALERDGATIDAVGAQRKLLAFLVILAASRKRGVGRERVALYLWPESNAQRARGALKQMLHVARQELGSADAILGTAELRLNPDVIESDIDAFMSALEARDLERAAAIYGGPFLDGFHLSGTPDFERWVDVQRNELAQRQAVAIEQLATDASALGDHASAVRWWQVRHTDDPLSGRVTLGLMHALDAVGDRAAAIRCATAHETSLRIELGNPPDPAVSALAARLTLESARGQLQTEATKSGVQDRKPALERGTEDAEAYDLYLNARDQWKLRTRDGFQAARRYYEAATDRDPRFARAWAGLAVAYVNLSNFGYMDMSEALALAERSADRAIELDRGLAEAHAAKGFVLTSRLEFAEAEETFRRVVALDPYYSFGHHYYTLLLLMRGRIDEALEQNREALRGDPLSRAANATTGITLCQMGDYAGATRELERALALAPEFPLTLYYLGVVYTARNAWDDALELIERAARQAPAFTGTPGALAYLYRRTGRKHEAEVLLESLRTAVQTERSHVNLALALGALGSLDEAFHLMEGLRWDVPSLVELRADPLLRPLRADPRYVRLLKHIGADTPPPSRVR